MPQQRAALGRPEPGHDLEHRLVVAPRALAAVPGDREAMRLVADALDEARRGAVRGGRHRCARAVDEQPLLPGLAVGTLRHSYQRQLAEAELAERLVHLTDLADAAVDQQHVGCGHLAIAHMAVAP